MTRGPALSSAFLIPLLMITSCGTNDSKPSAATTVTVTASPNDAESITSSAASPSAGTAYDAADPYMLYDSGTVEEVLGDYANTVSRIVNARLRAGNVETDGSDLRFLVDPLATVEPLEDIDDFVSHMASLTMDFELALKEAGEDPFVEFALVTEFISMREGTDGSWVVRSRDRYWALGRDGQSIGDVLSNIDVRTYTFSRADVVLDDGSLKNTFTLRALDPA